MKKLEDEINERGITRLCHFTKSKNFLSIINDSKYIYSVQQMSDNMRDINDEHRYDHKLDHISCSIQYPNVYYLERIKEKDILFNEWVVLLLRPEIMLKEETLFSPVNAASKNGNYIYPASEGLDALFQNEVISKYRCERTLFQPLNVPTDLQAEVLIYQSIEVSYIYGLLVPTIEQAKSEYSRLKVLGKQHDFQIWYCKDVFDKSSLASKLKNGTVPKEIQYQGGN